MASYHPNPYDTSKVVGAQGGSSNRALVVNVMDPLKSGRVQIRVVGHHDDEANIPDEMLPWVKVRNSTTTPSMQTATTTHGLLPGTMVTCEAFGMHGQDWLITGTLPNDKKDDNKTINSATQGKGQTDNVHTKADLSQAQHGSGNFAWGTNLKRVYEQKTTREARQRRDSDGRDGRKSERDRVDFAHSQAPTTDNYQNRSTSKDPDGGTIGVFKSMGKDPQQFIQQTIQNKSAVVQNALSAIQNLKQVNGNPTSIESIGAGNFSAILQQLAQLFKSNSSSKQDQQKYDCNYLLSADDSTLTPEMMTQKQTCIILQNPADNTGT
jgi:hypothetical protein